MKVNEMGNGGNVFEKDIFDIKTLNEGSFEGTLETFTVFVPADGMNLSKALEDYDYDMEASHNTFFWDELLPTLIVYCLTFVLGLVGNFLIVFTIFTYRKMKSTTNVFLASLASSDLLLILFCIPVKLMAVIGVERRKRHGLNEQSISVGGVGSGNVSAVLTEIRRTMHMKWRKFGARLKVKRLRADVVGDLIP